MKITVTGQEKEYPAGLTVDRLIRLENLETPQYVTVAVNDGFIKSDALEATILKEGDNIEFLYFMGGGR
ncbi:thiamine biosynthesis protein ThiS [Deltaproteobacteria bacterium]|nr:thiamine biosynthesis protein ThiS [Deltaproteobacteria bacterium]